MEYERTGQQNRPTDRMHGLIHALYEEKDTEKILAFYDPKSICWFGMTRKEEAYPIRCLREKLQAILDNLHGISMEKENYQVISETDSSCMISGNLDLIENGEQKKMELSAFWICSKGNWNLSRFCIQAAESLQEPAKDGVSAEKERSQALINLMPGDVLEYDPVEDRMDLYIQRTLREAKKHRTYSSFLTHGKALLLMDIYPDDREKLEKALLGKQDFRAVEYRFQEKEGLYSWKRLIFQKIRDPQGRLLRILGNITDINREMELEEEARKDSLTGAYNRHGLDTMMENYCTQLRQRKGETKGAVFLLDLDNFKNLNDICGHLTGDQVLKDLVEIVKSHFRSDDRIFRMGGDEFLVLMKDVPGKEIVQRKGREIIEDFSAYANRYDTGTVPLSISIGAVIFDGNISGNREIYQKADQALYEVKRSGKKDIRIAK